MGDEKVEKSKGNEVEGLFGFGMKDKDKDKDKSKDKDKDKSKDKGFFSSGDKDKVREIICLFCGFVVSEDSMSL